jgi:dTDP-4-amino-4,6-dideoxygalactose transaminase
MISYLDLKKNNFLRKELLLKAIENVFDSGYYILGPEVEKFENNYAAYSNTNYSIGVASGLDALILSLKAIDIQIGDEVIVPSNTYIATWLAVSYVGAKIIPVEPNIETYNLDPRLLNDKITNRTKAIIVVNLFGQSAELEEICLIAKRNNIIVIEDNAQAQGALYNNVKTGSWGDINATSFYPGKNLGALGDGGAITFNNVKYLEKLKLLRNYGSVVKYQNEIKGLNSRLDEIQAAILSVKLNFLDEENTIRVNLADYYYEKLQNVGDIILPKIHENSSSVHHIFNVRTKFRDELLLHLKKLDIGVMIHYPIPPHLQNAYKELNYKVGDFPIAEEIANTSLSLPLNPGLSFDDLDKVVKAIKSFFNE